VIGSRSHQRAIEAAAELRQILGKGDVQGLANEQAAMQADMIFVTIPYAGVQHTLPPLAEACRGKIVVSTIAPVECREGRPVAMRVEAGSAAQDVQRLLPESRVVSAFQVIDAHALQDVQAPLDTDVIVCSDDVEARREIVGLANRIPGVRALSGGHLATSRYVEAITALLITLNRIYRAHSGIRITGIER
jgi:NADPH-dependent F420 reductase